MHARELVRGGPLARRTRASRRRGAPRGDASADICFGFVGAAIQLAKKGRHREKLLRQALNAAIAGFRAAELPGFVLDLRSIW